MVASGSDYSGFASIDRVSRNFVTDEGKYALSQK
jgi:hypothetical protein